MQRYPLPLRRRVPFIISEGVVISLWNTEELTLPFASCNLSQALFQASLTERCSELKHKETEQIYRKVICPVFILYCYLNWSQADLPYLIPQQRMKSPPSDGEPFAAWVKIDFVCKIRFRCLQNGGYRQSPF